MTIRFKTKYKLCRRYKSDIWGRLFISKKITKFTKLLAPRPRTNISIGTFTGAMAKRTKIYRKRRTRYGKNLAVKQKLTKFYGTVKEFQFKAYFLKNKKFKKSVLKKTIIHLEKRLDTILFRSNLVKTIFDSKFYILHKKIMINNNIIDKPSYTLKLHDIVSSTKPVRIRTKLKRVKSKRIKFIWGFCPAHLHVNWKTFKISLHNIPEFKNLVYPFKLKQRRVLEYYKV